MDYLPDIPFMVFFELAAALVAVSTYFRYTLVFHRPERVLIFYLCFSVFTEFLGLYQQFIYDHDLVNSAFFSDNPHLLTAHWWFNIYTIVAALCFGYYFKMQIESTNFKRIAKALLVIFLVTTVLNLLISDVYFVQYSLYTDVSTVIILVAIISMYYYELLSSDRILSLGKSFAFLISIPVFLYYIVITPLFLLSNNYVLTEMVFMKFYDSLLAYGNFFLYGMFIFGYLWCYWFNKSLNRKSSSLSTSS